MTRPGSSEDRMKSGVKACYFGLEVEVLLKMENCSLIRFGHREFVVDTSDLVLQRELRAAA